jgi:hypothetical protein
VGEGVGIDGVGGSASSLDLLGNALSVRGCKDAELGRVSN